jgi:hypothetical protein
MTSPGVNKLIFVSFGSADGADPHGVLSHLRASLQTVFQYQVSASKRSQFSSRREMGCSVASAVGDHALIAVHQRDEKSMMTDFYRFQ